MPSVSIWIDTKIYRYLEELSKYLNKKPSKILKEILEGKIIVEDIENNYSIVRELYKWYYYQGNSLSNERYIRRILKRRNSESILNIISFHDDIRSILKTLGTLMLIVSLNSYARLPEENFNILKLIKLDLIEDAKRIKVFSLPLLYSKILWIRCIEKIRELSINKVANWESFAFTAGLYAITILGKESPEEVYAKYNLSEFEKEWNELIKRSIEIANTEEKLIKKCILCRNTVSGTKCSCGNSEFLYDDLNI